MFENLVNQSAGKLLISDIKHNKLPGAVLFAGPEASGKLTAALETARILSCHEQKQGEWLCECPSCLQHKALICSNLMLLGPRDCSLEIAAASKTFTEAHFIQAKYIDAVRYLFLRSVRKLTLRFNGILWEGDSNLNKIGSIIEEINENLEQLDFPRELPDNSTVKKLCDDIAKQCMKLEDEYLYDSIPVNQIRNMEAWAHIKSEEGRKTVIIENADRMQTSVRNALLKILEEPPADVVFILLSSKRNAIMQTILSRVRTYNFTDRTVDQQKDVIQRVFHNMDFNGSLNDYLLTYLPVTPSEIKAQARSFYNSIVHRQICNVDEIVKKCDKFNPRIELRLFLSNIAMFMKPMMKTQSGSEAVAQAIGLLRNCSDNIILYNQSPVSALEILLRDMSALNIKFGGVFCEAM
ncbi:DNA polymerase-3 subunit gamma/tau [Treponema bryantii]|uniref:DNA polymerase-3 subunit gamma/tau n=1 Tax=Treponema bryantii TaxID=163 RepID=A0A1I3KAJ9_9SPIR|nr:DNA polymerase III [Treponema bryantii]SFI69509.1 DNA polymerase-3 subunit gamma/tau [Treponema bryantii]